MSEENKRVVRRYFEMLDRGRATPVDLCAPGFTFHVAGRMSLMQQIGALPVEEQANAPRHQR